MDLFKLGIYASTSSAIGTTSFILIAWVITGFNLPSLVITLAFSLVGAMLGSAIGWHLYFAPFGHAKSAQPH